MLSRMSTEYKFAIKHRLISWLLITAILLVAILPIHYHLHHLHGDDNFGSAATTHDHLIDVHLLTDSSGQAHHDEAISIAASPDGIINKLSPDFSPFLFLTAILLLLPTIGKRINIRLVHTTTRFKQHELFFTPQLRAPPLH